LNAADEIAVEAFLDRRLSFPGIARVIEGVLDRMPKVTLSSISDVLAADGEARRLARLQIETQLGAEAKAGVRDSQIHRVQ
jgi:1-deoxy-D-xylulose-5-phosphate reductoisomerase